MISARIVFYVLRHNTLLSNFRAVAYLSTVSLMKLSVWFHLLTDADDYCEVILVIIRSYYSQFNAGNITDELNEGILMSVSPEKRLQSMMSSLRIGYMYC